MTETAESIARAWIRGRAITLRKAADDADGAYTKGKMAAACKLAANAYRAAADLLEAEADTIEHETSRTLIHPSDRHQTKEPKTDDDYDLEPPPACVAKNNEAIEKLRERVRKSVAHVNALDVTLAGAIARFNREADGFRSTHDLLGLLQDRVGRLEVNDD